MTKIYEEEEVDVDMKVFFNIVCLPAIMGIIFNSFYIPFVLGAIIIFVYEFVLLDEYNEIYTKEEIEVKKDTLHLGYILYIFFLFVFWQDIVNYIKG